MTLVEVLLTAIVSSATVSAVLVFALKRYLGGQIDWHFKRRELEYESARRSRDQISEHYLSQRLGIYPEISQLVYRLRNAVNDGMSRPHIAQWDDEFVTLCGELTDGLFRWEYFLPKPLFRQLHDFKRAVQNMLVFYDIRTRPDELDREQAYIEALDRMRPVAATINRLHGEITAAISLETPAGR
ncbi:MAG: hypothetical protein H6983_21475 [Ectothiorhodospiraceae bacterium]|nr:hypothetical protein [Chromatiales bacterium]MCP5156761.1 hypothetical protein [Ectothiorhodospiraceae bacterium]